MKWKNIEIGACYHYVTGTCTGWLPVFSNPEARKIVAEEMTRTLAECGGFLSAFVIMPTHVHPLAYLPYEQMLHSFNRRWRGRSARRPIDLAKARCARVS